MVTSCITIGQCPQQHTDLDTIPGVIRTCMCVSVCLCVRVCVSVCVYACVCVCVSMFLSVCVWVSLCVCVSVCALSVACSILQGGSEAQGQGLGQDQPARAQQSWASCPGILTPTSLNYSGEKKSRLLFAAVLRLVIPLVSAAAVS